MRRSKLRTGAGCRGLVELCAGGRLEDAEKSKGRSDLASAVCCWLKPARTVLDRVAGLGCGVLRSTCRVTMARMRASES